MNLEMNLRFFLSYLTDIEWQFDYETIVIYIEISMR